MEGSSGMDRFFQRLGFRGAEAAEDPAQSHAASVTVKTITAAPEDNTPAPDGLTGSVAGKRS